MSALVTAFVVCWDLWALRRLARQMARYDVPWLLEQDALALTPHERALLVERLGAWEVGKRLRQSGEKARGP